MDFCIFIVSETEVGAEPFRETCTFIVHNLLVTYLKDLKK